MRCEDTPNYSECLGNGTWRLMGGHGEYIKNQGFCQCEKGEKLQRDGWDLTADGLVKRQSSGGCFVSTLVFNYLGKDDNCQELNTLREFRDKYLLSTAEGSAMVELYYKIAPSLISKVNACGDDHIYKKIHDNYLVRVLDCINKGKNEEAVSVYKETLQYIDSLPNL